MKKALEEIFLGGVSAFVLIACLHLIWHLTL